MSIHLITFKRKKTIVLSLVHAQHAQVISLVSAVCVPTKNLPIISKHLPGMGADRAKYMEIILI